MKANRFTAASIASSICIVLGWIALVGGVASMLLIAANAGGDDDEKIAAGLAAVGALIGGLTTWALLVTLGYAVKIGLAILNERRAVP